ncbi:hypothetical protein HDU85_004825 [Gaertneriomyces sp. JEL0708]|nr:hypothetical protein HDU85_004825 [Gaertneriomyces sp. JEL0708]
MALQTVWFTLWTLAVPALAFPISQQHVLSIPKTPVNGSEPNFASKTPYPAPAVEPSTLEGYQLEQVQVVLRHASRAPTEPGILDMRALQEHITSSPSLRVEYEWIRQWKPVQMDEEGLLTASGEREAWLLGTRFKGRYHRLLQANTYYPHLFRFISSRSPRSFLTGHFFASGLFSQNKGEACHDVPSHGTYIRTAEHSDSHITNPHGSCPEWKKVAKSQATRKILKDAMHEHLSPIAERLGQKIGVSLRSDDVWTIYHLCTFGHLVPEDETNETKRFCALLSDGDLEKVSYVADLRSWAKMGYGELNANLGCAVVTDVIDSMSSRNIMDVRLGHSETVVALVRALGIYGEAGSRPDLPPADWRTSDIIPFLANVVFELYSSPVSSDTFVRVLHNERPVTVPGCPIRDDHLCNFANFQAVVKQRGMLDCKVEDICHDKTSNDVDLNTFIISL